ncbi:MAG: hypothetical protein BWY84_00051 [Candidatus Aerophobetes bacterium ADurb.Bin490]|nr:MAG: hypothetical protein BWY84_00051 [Candidatus Aerophobetes bacterium ADurb.Bin490]
MADKFIIDDIDKIIDELNKLDKFIVDKMNESNRSMIESDRSMISFYKQEIKNETQSIKNLRELIKENKENVKKCKSENADHRYINLFQGWLTRDTARLKSTRERKTKLQKKLKNYETKLLQKQIKNFASSNQKFTVIQGGLCET